MGSIRLFLGNHFWVSQFDSDHAHHLPRMHSDNAPILLVMSFHNSLISKIFPFENFWFDFCDCHKTILKAWKFQ